MHYHMKIMDVRVVTTTYYAGSYDEIQKVELVPGNCYRVVYRKPTGRQRLQNNRAVKMLGLNADWEGDVIVRYLDTGKRGRVRVNCLLPINEDEI